MIAFVLFKYGVRLDDPCCYPLGFMYVAARVKSMGYQIKVLNFNLYDYDLREELKGVNHVFMTGFEEFEPQILATAALCNELGITTHIGGAIATHAPERVAQAVSVLYAGEYDHCYPLDSNPYPLYDEFGVAEYHKLNGIRHIGVLSSRGCPHACTFCAHTCKFRVRSIDKVFDEIDHYKAKYSPELIVFNDNTLNFTKRHFMEICSRMKDRRLPWTAAVRVDNFDDEMARTAKDALCHGFVVGVEGLKQSKLDAIKKGVTVRQVCDTLDLFNKYDIKYHGNIVLGLEGDTYEDVQEELYNVPWSRYTVFPVLLHPFVGSTAKRSSLITNEQYAQLEHSFTQYAEGGGKFMNTGVAQ